MDKKLLKSKFSEYLKQEWTSIEKLDKTIDRFWSSIFDMFFDWLKYLERFKKNSDKDYNSVFKRVVLPQMKYKVWRPYWDIYFKPETYDRYKLLFFSFIKFVEENKKYIHELKLGERKEILESSIGWMYWKNFNKKALIHAWHNYIQTDTWENWDKLRWYLEDIYKSLNDEELRKLYDVLFDSYEICSKITSENHENKWKENFEKRDAFGEAFSSLKKNLWNINEETLSKIKSLFWKYLNFIPRYRDKLTTAIKWKPEQWKIIQKHTELSLFDNLAGNEKNVVNENHTNLKKQKKVWDTQKRINLWSEWDWLWPDKVIGESRDPDIWIYDINEIWDIKAPLDNYWLFPDSEKNSE